jgi:cell division protein FtsA
MSRTIVAGIDPGDQAVKVVVLKVEADTPRILALAKREARGFRHGYITNQEEAEESIALAIKDAEKASGERIRRAVISAGSVSLAAQQVDGLAMVARADAEITDLDVKRALQAAENKVSDLANRRVLDTIPISFKLDSRKVLGTPRGMRGAKLEAKALFVSALTQHMDDLEGAVHGAGIKIEDIIPGAVAASFVTLSEVEKAAGCILAVIGSDTVSTAVFEEGMLVSLQVFPIGSRDITHDIALGLRIPIAEAEDIKINREYASFNKKKLDEIIEARLSDIFELIDNHLKKLGRSELLPAGIILTGGGALLPGIEASARSMLRLPARIALPLFPYQFRLKQENLISRLAIKDSSFATAYGLAIAGLFPSHAGASSTLPNSTWNDFQGKAKDWFSQFLP